MMLYRPVNQAELDLIQKSGWKKFPPRLPSQPIFYPVLNEEYATQITKEWNVSSYGIGHVVKFEVLDDYIRQYKIQQVGLDHHLEFWIPAEDLEVFNAHIVGKIDVICTFKVITTHCLN